MLPVIAIVGRPNVGKSTLFNRLTKTRDALVVNEPGVTRDRQYGQGQLGDRDYIVVDTGGIGETEDQGIDSLMLAQAQQAIQEADVILFMLDAKTGTTGADEVIANHLRALDKPTYLLANKTDGLNADVAIADFYSLALGEPHPIAAAHGRGIATIMTSVLAELPETEPVGKREGIKLAIVGRPNVGKSTLTNRMLGEERVIVFDQPGTTRDSISIDMERLGEPYTLIDTAGLRRKARVDETVEKFSAIKTLQSINEANVVIMVLDAQQEISQQDLFLLSHIVDAGRALVIAVNKWDNLPQDQRERIKTEMDRKLQFVDFAKTHFISALHGTGVGDLFSSVDSAFENATKTFSTSTITNLLETALKAHQPPMVRGRRIKLRHAHMGGQNPPIIVIHGNLVDELPGSYIRYLTHHFRKGLKFDGTPIRIQFKTGDNPYKDIRNKLTLTQRRRKKRLMAHAKGLKKKPKRR